MINKKKNNKIFKIIFPFSLGLISSFSLPPYNFFLINFITLPLLFSLIVNNKKNINLFFIGWLFGFGYFLSSLYWIAYSLTFDENMKIFIPIGLILVPTFLAIFYGLSMLLIGFFKIKYNFSSIIIFAIIFSIVEFVRGYVLGGFPWNLIAYSWSSFTSFIQIISFVGTYSFNLLSITLFLLPTIFLFKITFKKKTVYSLLISFLLIINVIYGSYKIKKFNEISLKKIPTTIKVISPKIEIDRFYKENSSEEIIKNIIEISKPINSEDTLFILPEGILTDIYLNDLKKYKNIFQTNFSNNHKIILGINSLEDEKIYNTMVLINNNLDILQIYKKNKLVPFGEFIPFENFFASIGFKKITEGYQSFSFDNKREAINFKNIKFLPLICYEIIYSGRLKKNDDDITFILNISEDGWFGNSIGIHQHFVHSKFRAIEEGSYLIRAANNGISAYIDPNGIILKNIESTSKGFIDINSYKKTKKTLFSVHGNKLFLYFLIIYIILFFFLKKRGSSNEKKLSFY